MQIDRSGIFGNDLCQIHDLLLGALRRIRRRMKIGRIDGNTALCNHVACHRAVDSAGKKQHGFSVCSDRHTSRSRNDRRVHIDLVADLDIKHHLRLMDIHARLGERL